MRTGTRHALSRAVMTFSCIPGKYSGSTGAASGDAPVRVRLALALGLALDLFSSALASSIAAARVRAPAGHRLWGASHLPRK